MKAVFIHRGGPDMASYRLRTQIPAEQTGSGINEGNADILVFSKPTKADLELARKAKGNAAIVVDICDPHDYSQIVSLADRVVVSSEKLKSLYKDATYIADPLEGEGGDPHAGPVGWIGHHSNLPALQKWLSMTPSLHVNVCTTAGKWPGAVPWSQETQRQFYAATGIMLVPASHEYKSNNRVTQAIHEGCFVIASELYREFRGFAWVGQYSTGARWALSRNDLPDVISEGQKYVRWQYSPEHIGAQWQSLLSSI